MYEEVCLLCGRPVTVDGRAYCSDECESLDATSPSVSATSSAYASPYLHSSSGPGNLLDVPALVPSSIGVALQGSSPYKAHKSRHSISSSSTSSAVWSVSTDEEEEEVLSTAADEELGCGRDYLSIDGGSKTGGSLGRYLYQPRGLSYARRPSGTDHRSTVPTLNRRTSSMSDPSAADSESLQSAPAPCCAVDDDFSDAVSSASSVYSYGARAESRHSRKASSVNHVSTEQEHDADNTITSKSRRNRVSLPAYFSLLTTSTPSPSSTRSQRTPSSLQTLATVTRSLQSSPPTPRVAHPIMDPITAYSQAHSKLQGVEATSRGRRRQRDPNARSSSGRSAARSPPRQSTRPRVSGTPPPCTHHLARISPQARARLDSIEKVTDWVSNSTAAAQRGRTLTRRNSSPLAKPQLETFVGSPSSEDDIAAVRQFLARSLHFRYAPSLNEDPSVALEGRRGRRKVEELDAPPSGIESGVAPGYGNGRSGLKSRGRSRGRTVQR
ncbi:uncharacterized protein LAESUDRAFT_646236 [Laetiporus sulphureus 93-53]|uniref:Uncharacterized protein n=1 Tax=Laetiporus sulphureus 93-53 TaxID=1314785 RepID=A0A165G250_9APHY|nr:uncharacterized protein LAESUDRAFT_646236 [Laetiporus sulphureus 93-53]KZT09726.1 hypothetical protein LAESUDRAFT_646236 [Laetiporus sulphureus 93-53]